MKKKKSWQEKLSDNKGLPKIATITPKMAGKTGEKWGGKVGDTVVIPAPVEVDEIMRKIPFGKIITINEIRAFLAKEHHATICCPITTGIFAWLSAHAAEEQKASNNTCATPYWRTLKSGGEINPKYPGGIEYQKKLLESEGHKIIQKGKKFFVADYKKCLLII
ncbi:MAG: MGMT family protein [Verrucomicrobiae bacterium]|nr:MGMT family protein [Verrucomicrobiae bacterium]